MYKIPLLVFSIGCLLGTGPAMAHEPPTTGWAVHIDAKRHIAGAPDAVAHHYCKEGIPGGVTACQLYDSDARNARLLGVEFVISAEAYAALPDSEEGLWHYHKEELGLVDPVMPDMSEEEAAEFTKNIEETYGKIFLIWNTSQDELPLGQPQAYDMGEHGMH